MVKKTYNQPTCLVVTLGTCKMMAESIVINSTYDPNDTNTYINSGDQILTKESKSLWDEEW